MIIKAGKIMIAVWRGARVKNNITKFDAFLGVRFWLFLFDESFFNLAIVISI